LFEILVMLVWVLSVFLMVIVLEACEYLL